MWPDRWRLRGGYYADQFPDLIEALERVPNLTGVGWVEDVIMYPENPRRRPKRAHHPGGAEWDPGVMLSDPSWERWQLSGSVELGARPSFLVVTVSPTTIEIDLSEGWAQGCYNEELVAAFFGPILQSLRPAISWLTPPSLHPRHLGPMSRNLIVLFLTSREPDLGWDGSDGGPFPDQRWLDALLTEAEWMELFDLDRRLEPAIERSPNVPASAFLLPRSIAHLANPDPRQMVSFFALSKGEAPPPPPMPGAELSVETSALGTQVLVTRRERYGMLDAATADVVVEWFRDWVLAGDSAWAILTPVAGSGSTLHQWLRSPSHLESPQPPLATWLLSLDGSPPRRHGTGPFPSRSALDASQEPLPLIEGGLGVTRLHPLDALALPTVLLPTGAAPSDDIGRARRGVLGEIFSLFRSTDRPWTLIGECPNQTVTSVCLEPEDWVEVARALGRDGFGIVSSCMAGVTRAWTLSTPEQVEPIVSLVEQHLGHVRMVPGIHGPMSDQKPHLRPGAKGALDLERLVLVGIPLVVRRPDGTTEPLPHDLDAATFSNGVLSAERGLLDGWLTLGQARRNWSPGPPMDERSAASLEAWFDATARAGIEPESTIELVARPEVLPPRDPIVRG